MSGSIRLSDSFKGPTDIYLDGEVIGVIWGNLEHFDYIKLDEEYRGNGYATQAIELYIEEARKSVKRMETTEVLSSTVREVLLSNGFEEVEPNKFVCEFDD